jgi:hypothetical protein
MPRLLEIADALEQLLANPEVLDEHGVLSPEGEAQLDALSAELTAKALDIGAYIKSERCEADAIKALAEGLRQRAERHERRAESLERYLASHLTPGMRLEDARCELTWRKSSAVEITGELAPEWMRETVTRAPMKTEIAKALKAGAKVDGATLVERVRLSVK